MAKRDVVRWRQATGVCVEDAKVTAVTMASSPAAPRETGRDEEPVGEGGVAAAIFALRERGALAGQVAVGLDARSVFFVARLREGSGEVDAAQALDQHFCAARPDGGLVGDADVLDFRGGSYLLLAACRRPVATDVQTAMTGHAHKRRRLEPAPFALVRLALRAAPAPRGAKPSIRVILDGDRSLALLLRGRSPLAWRPFSAPPENEVDAVAVVVRALAAHARADLKLPHVPTAVVHAPPTFEPLARALSSSGNIEIRVGPPVPTDGVGIATGLALGALGVEPSSPDLLRELRPPLSVREIFPWSVAAGVLAVAAGSWHLLASETRSVEAKAARTQAKIDAALKAARTKPGDLKAALKSARHEAELVSRFIGKRVPWAALFQELPAHVPESTVLVGLMGRDQLVLPSPERMDAKYYADRELSFRGQLRAREDDAAPDQIAEVIAGTAAFPLLLENFPRQDGPEVTRRTGKGEQAASFIVRCGARRF